MSNEGYLKAKWGMTLQEVVDVTGATILKDEKKQTDYALCSAKRIMIFPWGGGPGSGGSLPSPHTPLPTL
jgi:hypothetical protein